MPTRILIADDHAFVRRGLRLFLEGSGHDWVVCGEAQDGFDAVQRAKELRPDVIIPDLAMPKANGFEAAAQIAEEIPSIPVLLHTLYNSPQLQIEAKKYGIRMVVPKEEGAETSGQGHRASERFYINSTRFRNDLIVSPKPPCPRK
jgi:DNA-binding NarL/FixJ family response regulator